MRRKFLNNSSRALADIELIILRIVAFVSILLVCYRVIILHNLMGNMPPSYQWIFSGIGVLIVSWVSTLIYRRFKKEPKTAEFGQLGVKQMQSGQIIEGSNISMSESTVNGPVAGRDIAIGTYVQGDVSLIDTSHDEYRETPTREQIAESMRAVSLYLKQSVADSYAGLKVRWRMRLHNIRPMRDGWIDVTLSHENAGPIVSFVVRLADYPVLKTVHGGESVEVKGTIDYVQTNSPIHLKDVKLKFLS